MTRQISLISAIVLAVCTVAVAAEPEKWADGKLPVREGLFVWLDAARQSTAWQAHGKPQLISGAAMDVWYDGSGGGLDFVQAVKESQPRCLVAGDRMVVRFDGQNDFLGAEPVRRSVESFTMFVVAAPRSNAGYFRGFFAGHETGKNDYTTGFNIDMGGPASSQFDQINIEGKGFVGATDLLDRSFAFSEFHTIEVSCAAGESGVQLAVDGRLAGTRKRQPGKLLLDGMLVAARVYSNSPEPPAVGGFLDGDLAEVLLYDRVLNDAERVAVRDYLARKHDGLTELIAAGDRRGGRRLQPITDAPLVQMLVPGFTVRELPVELNNLNNLRYRSDGKLVVLGYDGNIHLLSDTDGDGLEDRAELFWNNQGRLRGPIGIALAPPGTKHPTAMPGGEFGVFVASKGKLSLIVDSDGDDRADRELIVATGWKEIPQNVDAVGVAIGPDGSIYFALGTANYANGYLLDESGKSQYDLKSERGTVIRVSPDFSRREIVCTGTRFPVALAFNRLGDLFASEQEGATWLPNGNPFDELLHIQPGRHYGFPPRHPRHLPGVIDEPSVFDYGPQHQSTCGLVFNEPVNRGPTFGPSWWSSDALVCGESRGKLFRTKLAKTKAGYVAINQTIGCLGMLTVDACVSPTGDLVVATHSGPPDWGTGPQGKGKVFKITYSGREEPQPICVWPASPREVRIAFDRPLDSTKLKDLAKQSAIEFGPYVRAGDRFEVLKPPYAVVQQQLATLRYDLPVFATQVTADQRTIVLATGPHTDPTWHAVTLGKNADLAYDLTGITTEWRSESGDANWSGWLPHLNLSVSREFTTGSSEHDALWSLLGKPGRLMLRTQLDLDSMLRPSVQPGSTLDYEPPPEQVTLAIRSSQPIEVRSPDVTPAISTDKSSGRVQCSISITPRKGEWIPLEISLATGPKPPQLEIAFFTNEDSRERAIPVRRFRLPWSSAKPVAASELAERRTIPELECGDWSRGRRIYMSESAACSKCHSLRGAGGRIGPDLTNLPHRDYHSVLRDILEPSAAINPDHIGYTLTLKDGRVLTGVLVASAGDHVVLGDSTGQEISVAKQAIEELKPSPISAMPADLNKKLGRDEIRDLITFLMTEPLGPTKFTRSDVPTPRRRADFESLLKESALPRGGDPVSSASSSGGQAAGDRSLRPLHIALVAGPKDHGPDEHDYPLWQSRWSRLLRLADQTEISEADGWPTADQLDRADVIVFNSANHAWSADRAADVDRFLTRGGGLVFVHFATNGGSAPDALADRIGLVANMRSTRYRHGPLDLALVDPKHPITRGFDRSHRLERVHFVDESYWNMTGDAKRIHVLATADEEGQPRPLLWTREHGGGRVFVSILGHYTWTYDDPIFRMLLLRGICWTAREPADRFAELVTVGARIEN